jgi:alpha-N-acetylglucosamine transferase
MTRGKKSRFTVWEKVAVAVILILLIIIVLLIFNQEIKEYIEVFKNWYRNKI